MRMTVILVLLAAMSAPGQTPADSFAYHPDRPQPDMIFLSFGDIRPLSGIKREQLPGGSDHKQIDLISKLLSRPQFQYTVYNSVVNADSKNVYGYFQNNTFYLNFEGEFYRVPVFGSIAFFVANVKVFRTFMDPRFGYPSTTGYTYELREFLLDMKTGTLEDFSPKRAAILIGRDADLGREFDKLRSRKKKDAVYHYIRMYNEKHPFYFLK